MSQEQINQQLKQIGITDCIITVLGNNKYKLTIDGAVWIEQIKKLFKVSKWEFNKGKAVFWIGE